jgi:RNA polymerase-interacting CarD/CdnL/TRCF family regulator
LSFGERRLLDTARALLVTEMALAYRTTEKEMEAQIEEIFKD